VLVQKEESERRGGSGEIAHLPVRDDLASEALDESLVVTDDGDVKLLEEEIAAVDNVMAADYDDFDELVALQVDVSCLAVDSAADAQDRGIDVMLDESETVSRRFPIFVRVSGQGIPEAAEEQLIDLDADLRREIEEAERHGSKAAPLDCLRWE
jgi:hypothetical protein